METNNTQANIRFTDLVESADNGLLMVMYSYKNRPAGTEIITELIKKHGLSVRTVLLTRATSANFPHPVAIAQGCPNMGFLYSEKDFAEWVSKRKDRKSARIRAEERKAKRALDKARELERRAYALRQQHRNFQIKITDKEKQNENSN
jgi:phosphopentomutase